MNGLPSSTQTRRVRRTRDQWQTIISQYESGDLTQKAFCAKYNLGSVSFSKWYNRLKQVEDSGFVSITAPTSSTLNPATVTSEPSDSIEVRLELGDGFVLHLSRR